MKIYTKTGDLGETGLNGGTRVQKNDARVDAYGTIDELNAHLGFCASLLDSTVDETLIEWLHSIQNDLFMIGSHAATPHDSPALAALPPLAETMTERLEEQIDVLEEELPQLTNFILPGGISAAASIHIARTVCRRAERATIGIHDGNPIVHQYLNRLSDWLFVVARVVNHRNDAEETLWTSNATAAE